MNVTPVLTETPNVAAAPATAVGNGVKSARAKPDITAFKQQFKDCVLHDETANIAQAAIISSNNNDNSSVNDTMTQHGEVVGILEGFGLLDYLKGSLSGSTENVQEMPLDWFIQGMEELTTSVSLPEQTAKFFAELKQMGSSEQFAWMLSKEGLGKLPQDVQQQIIGLAKEYLGSLESTNNAKSADGIPIDQGLPTDGIENSGLMNLLLRLKTVQDYTAAADQNVQTDKLPTADSKNSTSFQTMNDAEQNTADKSALLHRVDSGIATPAIRQTPEASKQPNGMDAPVEVVNVQVNGPAATAPMTDGAAAVNAQEAPPQTDFVQDNVIRIVDKISSHTEKGRCEFDVALKPEFLGKLHIRLTLENGSMRVQIRAHDAAVKGVMCEQVSALQNQLKDKGISVTQIDVTYQSDTPSDSGYEAYRHNDGQNGSKQQQARQMPDWLPGTSLYDAMAATADYYLGGSSVEYLA